MKGSQDGQIAYEVVRSRRSTADIIIERDGSVLVRAPEGADDEQVEDIVKSKHYAPQVGVSPRAVDVRELGNRWASCSPAGDLAFHWRGMMAPPTIIDYLVVHELCHFRHRDHTDAFWNEVDKVMPEYRERKDWLRKQGAGLDV